MRPRARTNDAWIAGVDGCRGGWIACLRHLGSGTIRFRIAPSLARIVDGPEKPRLLAVDMPMGFADCAEPGGRACERKARALLKGRTSSVFATPCRAVLDAGTYADALALNRASSAAALGISKQCWNIVPRMREVDKLLRERPPLRRRIVECHPELAFARMNDGAPVIAPKRSAEGRRLRLALLEKHGFDGLDGAWAHYPRDVVAADDMLDAAAVCRTAMLILDGDGRTLPARPPKDAHGFPMRICW